MEQPLSGGLLNSVVRVGDTVRRPAHERSSEIQGLLRHVRRAGFTMAPEPLGFDDRGREVLSFIDGDTVGWEVPWPEWVRSDRFLAEVGRALRHYHDCAAGFTGHADPERGHIFCHNDWAPYNVVGRDGHLAGIIDWDMAAPGRPLSDLAFVAWQWVPLHDPFVAGYLGWAPDCDRAARLRLLLDSYGLEDRAGFIGAVADRIRFNRDVMVTRAAEGDIAYQRLVEQGHVAGMEAALAHLAETGEGLQALL